MVVPLLLLVQLAGSAPARPAVEVLRVPGGGIQPQVAVGEGGTVHLLSYRGEAAAGDLFYASSTDGGRSFSEAIRVNAHPRSAVAAGNVRGGHLALGGGGVVHVAWMGSADAQPRAPGGAAPMLYARLDPAGGTFEPERNLARTRTGLDGGGTVAADGSGGVYVLWHAPDEVAEDEAGRRVWVARSLDGGASFEPERAAWERPTGACACCGMRASCDGGRLAVLYRGAEEGVDRDTYALLSTDRGQSFTGLRVDGWRSERCVMSTAALAPSDGGMLAAWETRGQVLWGRLDSEGDAGAALPSSFPAPGDGAGRKHPALATNARGEVLLAWTEGVAWARGGDLAWQVFDAAGTAVEGVLGRAGGVPPWSLVAAFARPDGTFVLLY